MSVPDEPEHGKSERSSGNAQGWGSISEKTVDPEDTKRVDQAVSEALQMVATARNRIPSWQRCLTAAASEAAATPPDPVKLTQFLDHDTGTGPEDEAKKFEDKDKASQGAPKGGLPPLTTRWLLGDHGQLLIDRLHDAHTSWERAKKAVHNPVKAEDVVPHITAAQTALGAAMQHALFLTFLGDLLRAHIGERRAIADYCQDWGLTSAQVSTLWGWLTTDPLIFAGIKLPVAVDTANQCAYHKPEGLKKAFYAAAILWASALAFGAVVALFALLHWAGVTSWPAEQWGWKMFVLLLFVAIGAGAHLGSRVLNINYDNPIRIYDAGNIIDWLSLRWVGVLQMYIPVTVVVASLWGAGNVPTSFQKLGTAILAGYSADSFVRAALSKLQGQAGGKQAASPAQNATQAAPGGTQGLPSPPTGGGSAPGPAPD